MLNFRKKKFMILVALVLLIGVGLYIFAPHTPVTPKQVENIATLESYLTDLTASGNPPGLSVVVVKEGQVVYNQAFGYADGPRGEKATPDTVYHWWSMTKVVTAIAIMQLHEQGKLDLDDTVTQYLPWFKVTDSVSQYPIITIRNLLQHTSGLPDTIPAMLGWVHYDDATRNQTEVVKAQLPKFQKLSFEPGSKAAYSNLNYMVLGAVIEAVTGRTYEEYISDNVLQPLNMAQTGFLYTPAMTKHEASGTLPVVHFYTPLLPALLDPSKLVRTRQGKLLWLNRFYIDATPSTGLVGSGSDAARLMLAYLNGGVIEGRRILNRETITLLTETTPIDGRGLGWFVGEHQGRRFLEHAGGGPGFATVMRLYPDSGLGVTILTNGTDLDRSGLLDLLDTIDWP